MGGADVKHIITLQYSDGCREMQGPTSACWHEWSRKDSCPQHWRRKNYINTRSQGSAILAWNILVGLFCDLSMLSYTKKAVRDSGPLSINGQNTDQGWLHIFTYEGCGLHKGTQIKAEIRRKERVTFTNASLFLICPRCCYLPAENLGVRSHFSMTLWSWMVGLAELPCNNFHYVDTS